MHVHMKASMTNPISLDSVFYLIAAYFAIYVVEFNSLCYAVLCHRQCLIIGAVLGEDHSKSPGLSEWGEDTSLTIIISLDAVQPVCDWLDTS